MVMAIANLDLTPVQLSQSNLRRPERQRSASLDVSVEVKHRLENACDLLKNICRRAVAPDMVILRIVRQNGTGRFVVCPQALSKDVLPVVLTNDQNLSIVVAPAWNLRPCGEDVIGSRALRTLAARRHASDQGVGGHIKVQHNRTADMPLSKNCIKEVCLLDSSRVSIQNETARAVALRYTSFQNLIHQAVTDQGASGHGGLCCFAKL